MKKILLASAALIGLATAASAQECGGFLQPKCRTGDAKTTASLEALIEQGNRVVGLPSIVNFFEKRMVRQLYEMRDDPNYRTYTYIVTMTGEFVKLCDSIGYGINASIQFSNPEKQVRADLGSHYGVVPMPQAEPNGLWMPEGLAATYVMCLDPTTVNSEAPQMTPIYVEPEVIVSPFPLG